MEKKYLKTIKIPSSPGVYFFLKNKAILYVGKATSLKSRINSYFSKDLIETRGPIILDMVNQADGLKFQHTDSVLEAIILEANLIKKYQPKYNTKEKDDKSFNYVVITKDLLPRVLILREKNLEKNKYESVYGPFTNGNQLKEAMKIIRPIFPYFDNDSLKRNNKEFYKQLGLIPNNFEAKNALQKEPFYLIMDSYKNSIKNLKLFFEGKKKNILINFKKEMMSLAKDKKFEEANEVKKRIFALKHINDIALIKRENSLKNPFRIEAYDIAHMSGKNMVGVMTVIENGEINKNEYRKFIIRTQNRANDTGALEEVISRRFKHTEWKFPDIIVVDGGIQQLNKVRASMKNFYKRSFQEGFSIPTVSVLKNDKHKPKAILGDDRIIKKYKDDILLANDESHRFAISFHKEKRDKNFISNCNLL